MMVDNSYPEDIRVRKEAETLVKSGLKVLVVCPAKRSDKRNEVVNGVEILRFGRNYSNAQKAIFDILESTFDVNLLFYFGLRKVFKKYKIDWLHVHDLPLAGTGYCFKEKVKKGLILDLHENYPEALKIWFLWKKNPLIRLKNSIFMNPKRWSLKEKNYCEKYDKVVCVVDEMKEKLMTNFNIKEEKLVVISNHERKEFIENFSNSMTQRLINKDVFSVTYVGGFGPHRGLDTAIKAMPLILESLPHAKLFLVGKGSSDVEEKLKCIISDYDVEDAVALVGYRPFKEVASIMKSSDLNIIPHKANEHTNNTIPHKLFQIMMSKSLILVSSCKPLKRIVEKYDAGLVFQADNEKDFAKKVIEASGNHEKVQSKIRNAYYAVMHSENWELESQKLINLYDSFAN